MYGNCKHLFLLQTKEKGKALLKSIAARRIEQEPAQGVAMNESAASEGATSSNMDIVFSPHTVWVV